MKKLLIILLMLFPLAAESATITATKAGNWSDTSVWDLGRIPAAGDDVALAGYDIVWDTGITRIPATGALTSISSTGTDGQITLALDAAEFHGGASLYCTTLNGNGSKPTTEGTLLITGTTDHVLTIVTGTGAGEGLIAGGAVSTSSVYHNGTGTVNVTGNITGGGGNSSMGFYNKSTAVGTVKVAITGGAGVNGAGIYNSSTGSVSVAGSLTSGAAGPGFTNASTGAVSINGGNISGGTGTSRPGFYNASTGQVTLSAATNLIQGTKSAAFDGTAPAWQPTSTSYVKFYIGTDFGQAANTEFKRPQTTGSAQ
jgi:hypothetical protein